MKKEDVTKQFIGGVIMDVTSPEQAKIAEAAGAVAVMALERIPGCQARGTWPI